jgi:hypothetical protein
VALAKARLGRPEFPHDQAAYEALRAATASLVAAGTAAPVTLTLNQTSDDSVSTVNEALAASARAGLQSTSGR